MNVFIIAAQTADGFIAQNADHSPFAWTSKDDKRRFVALTKAAGVVIMGSSTYKTLPSPLKDRHTVVYSRDTSHEPLKTENASVEWTNKSPQNLLADLEARGYKDVAICGGSHIYTLFMKSGLVSKIYLTTEPLFFGQGMSLFNETFDVRLTLVSQSVTENGTIFTEYDVVPFSVATPIPTTSPLQSLL